MLAFSGTGLAITSWPVLINSNNIVSVTNTSFGAVGDGVITNTTAIQNAINAVAKGAVTNGLRGGVVRIPPGTFLCGPLNFSNNVNLQMDAGAMLRLLPYTAYPGSPTNVAPFISGSGLTNIAVTGSGIIDGQGSPWWPGYKTNSRPAILYFPGCSKVLLQSFTSSNPPTAHIALKGANAGGISIIGVKLIAPPSDDPVNPSHNTDGVDLAETNVLFQSCFISTGDDNVAMGSSSSATADILMTNCFLGEGHGCSIGSYTSGGVSNLTMVSCTFSNTGSGIKIKSQRDRGGLVQNLNYYDLTMTNVDTAVIFYSYYEFGLGTLTTLTPQYVSYYAATSTNPVSYKPPVIQNITISNLTATIAPNSQTPLMLLGLPDYPISNVVFKGMKIVSPSTDDVQIYNTTNIQFIDCTWNLATVSDVQMWNADVIYTNSTPSTNLLVLDGLTTNGIGNSVELDNVLAAVADTNAIAGGALTLAGTTLTISNNLALTTATPLNYILGSSPASVAVKGNLTLGGLVNVSAGAGFGSGVYPLVTYTGTLTGALPTLTMAASGYICGLDTGSAGIVRLVVGNQAAWQSQDVGAVGLAGSYACANNIFTVAGSGADIYGSADAFRFAYLAANGDSTIIARVASVPNTDPWAKAGVMIRESLAENAANAFIALTPGNGVTWQSRASTGGSTGFNQTGGITAPGWVKLVRSGNTFTGYYSTDGLTWIQQGTTTIAMSANVYIGIAVCSHNNASLCSATFDNVLVLTPPGIAGLNSQSVPAGTNVVFNPTVTGMPTPVVQWQRNGVNLTDGVTVNGSVISGSSTTTLTISGVQSGDGATYSLVASNSAGTATGSATLSVNNAIGFASLVPTNGQAGVCWDTPLSITFTAAPTLRNSGKINIFNATNSAAPVDTIDLSLSTSNNAYAAGVQSYVVAGMTLTNFPVIINGLTAVIYPHQGILSSNQTYYVTVDGGTFTDSNGVAFSGILATNLWRFTTKVGGPANVTNLVVAQDYSGDFATVQGAVNFVPSGNTMPTVINIRNGTYTEIVNINSKNYLDLRGQSRGGVLIGYPNNNNLNPGAPQRSAVIINGNDCTLETLTVTNMTPVGGGQAEAVDVEGTRAIFYNMELDSHQDTFLVHYSGNLVYFRDSLITGDTDSNWGYGTVYYTNCEIRALSPNAYVTQPRSPQGSNGFGFINCRITKGYSGTGSFTLGRTIGNTNSPSEILFANCLMDDAVTGYNSDASTNMTDYACSNLTATAAKSLAYSTHLPSGNSYVAAIQSASTWLYGWQPLATPNTNGLFPWQTLDIGAVGVAGSAFITNGVYSVAGSGADIQGTNDAFRFVYLTSSGDCTIVARVTSLQNTFSWAKAGVMIRETLATNAANVFMALTPGSGVTWQYRSSTGGATSYNNTTGLSAPYWVKLVRSGNTFTGYCSPDGTNWTQQGTAVLTLAANVYIGLAVTSHNNGSLCTATFDKVGVSWRTQDIGSVGMTGNAGYTNGVFTVAGAGADIQGTNDTFRFAYLTTVGDCAIVARVANVPNINSWAKAGVMIRESLATNAANAFVALTPGNGVTWQYRSGTGGGTSYNNTTGLTAPYWVKLVRSGKTFTGYCSADGTNWTQQGTALFTMATNVYIGLAVTSHNSASLCAATFDNVSGPAWVSSNSVSGSTNIQVPPGNPSANIAAAISGTRLTVSWATTNIGWTLQSQTNSLSATNWVDVPASAATNEIIIPIDPSQGNVFFRLKQ